MLVATIDINLSMTSKKTYMGGVIALTVFLAFAAFLGNQRLAHADSLAESIICATYAQLQEAGSPIPPELESTCGGSSQGPIVPPLAQCMDGIDNDGDTLIDLQDPQCFLHPEGEEGSTDGGGDSDPVDVCPNIEGTQTEIPSGKVMDGADCVDAPTDNGGGGETPDPTPSTGGGSSGGGGGGGGSVLGTATSTLSCDTYITSFIRTGQTNDSEQVKRVQGVLRMFEESDVEENGEYDEKSAAAVRAFQLKYADEVLTPWGITQPTGYVFLTTRKKLNEIYCKNTKQFPLTAEEAQHIELMKKAEVAPKSVHVAAPATPKPAEKPEPKPVVTVTTTEQPMVEVTGNPVSNFFKRLFGRFR